MANSADTTLRFPPAPQHVSPDDFAPAQRAVLDKINRKVAAAASLKDLVDFLFTETRDLFPCDRISVAFVEEGGRRIRSYYTAADYEPILLGVGYAEDVSGSSLGAVIERGTPRIINDLEQYLRARPQSASARLIVREGVRSNLTCPLRVEGRNVGVLFRSSRRPNAYTDEQVLLHLAVAERLSQAVEKAYRIEQLEAANRAYFEMLGFVTHELKSPVASMVTDAQLLAEGYLGALDDRQRKKLEGMMTKGKFLLGLIREYLELARVEGGDLKASFEPVGDLSAAVVEPALEIAAGAFEEKKMHVVREAPPGPVAAKCDPNLLRIVLVNLLTNAAKYGFAGGVVRVRIAAEGEDVRLSVWNEGPGFSASDKSKLFRRFSRLDKPELKREKGTGVGLYTCWRIVQLHGGRVTADAEESRWAEFTVRIPRQQAG